MECCSAPSSSRPITVRGLAGAGKTSLIEGLLGHPVDTSPHRLLSRVVVVSLVIEKRTVDVVEFDTELLPDEVEQVRHILTPSAARVLQACMDGRWRHLIYVVNAQETDRLPLARQELRNLICVHRPDKCCVVWNRLDRSNISGTVKLLSKVLQLDLLHSLTVLTSVAMLTENDVDEVKRWICGTLGRELRC
ncbi:MAG: uncharacterized protein KVP18_002118 [Porospora cf. gigantea A]|uniref:uncharacterized protein n=1 Tax=Porospora cf. gigantea A TaxID=2853593 RepID=UPI00355AAA69|nr:MAG: hypothetical protein KVP18_002118 [Porospora cf. gigantea A]